MTTREELSKLDKGMCYVLSYPIIDYHLCAIADARILKSGKIKLTYTDGTIQKAQASKEILDADMDSHSLFEWVSHVQSKQIIVHSLV